MAAKTVVILGGGSGGLVAANRLRRLLGKEHRVVLVDRNPVYSFPPAYTSVMLGRRDARRISRRLANLSRKGIEGITGRDPRARQGLDLLPPGRRRGPARGAAPVHGRPHRRRRQRAALQVPRRALRGRAPPGRLLPPQEAARPGGDQA